MRTVLSVDPVSTTMISDAMLLILERHRSRYSSSFLTIMQTDSCSADRFMYFRCRS